MKATVIPKELNIPKLSHDMSVSTYIVPHDPKYMPKYYTPGAACVDLVVRADNPIVVTHRNVAKIRCGFSMELPPGYKAEISLRSGWGSRGLVIPNAPGKIDSDYRGEVCVQVINCGRENPITINDGNRIAQMEIMPVYRFDWVVTDKLSQTTRGDGGFGSTG